MKERAATFEDLLLELWFRERNQDLILHKTKDGTIIPINKMSNSHLVNLIKLVEKQRLEDDMEELSWLDLNDIC